MEKRIETTKTSDFLFFIGFVTFLLITIYLVIIVGKPWLEKFIASGTRELFPY